MKRFPNEPTVGKTNGRLVHHHLLRQEAAAVAETTHSAAALNGMSDLLSLAFKAAAGRSVIRDKKVDRRMKRNEKRTLKFASKVNRALHTYVHAMFELVTRRANR